MSRVTLALRHGFAVAVAAVLFISTLADPVAAQRGKWERLATKKVNMLADRDVIEMDRSDGRFNALRFNAVVGNINIYRIRVTFGNGEQQDLELNKRLREGEDTGAIDLEGRARVIDKIEMLYASSNLLKRAELEVFGRLRPGSKQQRADETNRNDDRDLKSRRLDLADWKKLGQRQVDLDFEQDRIWVGVAEGWFDKIVLRAKGGAIRIRNLKVVYGNGEVDDIPVQSRLANGELTQPLDLKGRHRGIRRVELTYRRGGLRLRPVLVEVFGRPRRKSNSDGFGKEPVETGRSAKWQVLGSRDVDLSLDRDVIKIERRDGPFVAIALRARGNAVQVYDIRVTFGNGKRQTFRLDEELRPGRRSKVLDLEGRARRITKVEMLYEKARSRGRRATIEVLGRKVPGRSKASNADRPKFGERALPRGWNRVGEAVIKRRSKDALIEVEQSRERYRQVALRVTGGTIRLRSATITFRNGRRTRLRVNGAFRDGDQTDPIDLPGGRRAIKEIELDFEPLQGRRAVTVEVIGKS